MIRISIPELNLGFPYLVAKKEDVQVEPQSQNIITKTCLFKYSESFTRAKAPYIDTFSVTVCLNLILKDRFF